MATSPYELTEEETELLQKHLEFYQSLEIPLIGKTEVGFDGRRVWQRSAAAQGLMEENDLRARAVVRSLRAAELWDYKKDDRPFDYAGKDRMEGVEFEVLRSTYTTQDGKDLPARYYFDPEGALRLIAAGEFYTIRLEFSDFRPVEGIIYPFRIKFTGPETFVETVVQEIKHNVALEGATFEFRELLEFIEQLEFDRLGAFAYSPQEGTRAAALLDDVPERVKQDRLAELLEVQRAISAERLGRLVGAEVEVLVDEGAAPDDPGDLIGRSAWQADDVDGCTYLRTKRPLAPGAFVRARVTATLDYDVIAEPVA